MSKNQQAMLNGCDTNAQKGDEPTGDIRGLDRRAMEDPTWRLAMASAHARYTPIVCLLCGCPDVCSDEVMDHGVVLLGECPRCDHRWMFRMSDTELEELLAASKADLRRPRPVRSSEMPTAA